MAEGQRSASIKYPRVWSEFTVLKPNTQKFKIGDVPEKLFDTIIEELIRMRVINKPIEPQPADDVTIAEKKEWWRMILKQRLSLMCYAKPIAGKSIVEVFTINARWSLLVKETEGEEMKWRWALLKYLFGRRSLYAEFNVSEAIVSLTLFTSCIFSESKVYDELYKCRGSLCQATGTKLFLEWFAIKDEQHSVRDIAIEAGYQEYERVPYEEVASVDSSYQASECDYFVLMFKFYNYDVV